MNRLVLLLAALSALPVAAKEVGSLAGQGAGIVIFDEQKACPSGSSAALYVDARQRVTGCWFEAHDRIWLFFEDGDNWAFPKTQFKMTSI